DGRPPDHRRPARPGGAASPRPGVGALRTRRCWRGGGDQQHRRHHGRRPPPAPVAAGAPRSCRRGVLLRRTPPGQTPPRPVPGRHPHLGRPCSRRERLGQRCARGYAGGWPRRLAAPPRPPAAARRVVEHLANNHRLEPFAAPDDDRALRLPGPESAGLTYHPEVGLLIDGHRCTPGRRSLADLLTTAPGTAGPYLYRGQELHDQHQRGDDPVLYEFWRDLLPARTVATAYGERTWYTDLVAYQPGVLANGEPHRSVGHWIAPSQLEVFDVLHCQVLMVAAAPRQDGELDLHAQVCAPGQSVVVPFGVWHSTYVLSEPALVVNIYADVRLAHGVHTGRAAALDPGLKYHGRPPLRVAALHPPSAGECTLTGPDLAHSHQTQVLRDLTPFDLPAHVCLVDLVLSDDDRLHTLTTRAMDSSHAPGS